MVDRHRHLKSEVLLHSEPVEKANWENIKKDLKSIQNTVNTMKEMNHPINSIWDHFKTSLEESIKRNVPIKTTREKRWMSMDNI